MGDGAVRLNGTKLSVKRGPSSASAAKLIMGDTGQCFPFSLDDALLIKLLLLVLSLLTLLLLGGAVVFVVVVVGAVVVSCIGSLCSGRWC